MESVQFYYFKIWGMLKVESSTSNLYEISFNCKVAINLIIHHYIKLTKIMLNAYIYVLYSLNVFCLKRILLSLFNTKCSVVEMETVFHNCL